MKFPNLSDREQELAKEFGRYCIVLLFVFIAYVLTRERLEFSEISIIWRVPVMIFCAGLVAYLLAGVLESVFIIALLVRAAFRDRRVMSLTRRG